MNLLSDNDMDLRTLFDGFGVEVPQREIADITTESRSVSRADCSSPAGAARTTVWSLSTRCWPCSPQPLHGSPMPECGSRFFRLGSAVLPCLISVTGWARLPTAFCDAVCGAGSHRHHRHQWQDHHGMARDTGARQARWAAGYMGTLVTGSEPPCVRAR